MNDVTLLVGSLSNDLFRVAQLTQRGSIVGAKRFLLEAKRWAGPLSSEPVARYIARIATEISCDLAEEISMEKAERYLMYGILLQNYSLHMANDAKVVTS
jgi:hypothetical protein